MRKKRLQGLLKRVIAPKRGERVLVITDRPGEGVRVPSWKMPPDWRGLRSMAGEWLEALREMGSREGFEVKPLLDYEATYQNNKALPKTGRMDGAEVDIEEQFDGADVYIALTSYSATKPLKAAVGNRARALSMPGVNRKMEGAMLADYEKMRRAGGVLSKKLEKAVGAEVLFSTGHKLYVDLRSDRPVLVDDGRCREAGKVINFPGGEVFKVPYEGTIEDKYGKSATEGEFPVYNKKTSEVIVCKLEENRIAGIEGGAKSPELVRLLWDASNLAEFAFGLNEEARDGDGVPVLEREKTLGWHGAFGDSVHLGGRVGDKNVHQDFVYTARTKIKPTISLVYGDGKREKIMEKGRYVIKLF